MIGGERRGQKNKDIYETDKEKSQNRRFGNRLMG